MSSNFIPDSQFVPDQAAGVTPAAGFIPEDQFIPDNGLTNEQIVQQYQKHQAEFGTPAQQGLALLEGAARGITLGASDFAADLYSTPEAVRNRQVANPATSLAGNVGGNVAIDVLTGGAAAPLQAGLVAKGVGSTAARALAYGAEGAIMGAANTVSDAALGDTKLNAQKIITDIGFGAAIGSGLGLLSKGLEAIPTLKKAAKESPLATVEDMPIVEGAKVPKSHQDLKNILNDVEYMGQGLNELPPKVQELDEALSRLPDLQIMPTNIHKEMLLGKTEQDRVKALLKKAPEFEDDFNSVGRVMRKEVDTKTDDVVKSIAPDYVPTSDAYEAGDRISKVFKDNYLAEQKEAGQLVGKIKKLDIGTGDHIPPLLTRITTEFPDAAKLFDTSTDIVKLKDYSSTSGISKDAYDAIKTIVKDLDNGARDISELFNVRKEIEQFIDYSKGGNGAAQVSKIKSIMMDYAQSIIDESGIDLAAKDAFRRYAVNESEREIIKKLFGVQLKGGGFDIAPTDVKERILGQIFKDTRTVQAARNILPKEEFNKVLTDYMSVIKGQATKDGVVSSAKLGTILNDKKQYALDMAFSEAPEKLQRLKDLNTVARLVPDLPSSNPSGTAETAYELAKNLSGSSFDLGAMFKKYGLEKIEKHFADKELNQLMAGTAEKADKINSIKKIIEKTNKKIESKAKEVFKKGRLVPASILINTSTESYNERVNRIKELSQATAMMQHLDNSTSAMNSAAPNITNDINNTMIRGVEYLKSKMPTATGNFVFNKKFNPSKQEIYEFNKAFQIVNDPLSSLDEVKNGTLTNQTIEALKAVHPELYKDMQAKVLENITETSGDELDYSVKLSISKFLETPLDEHMVPENLLGYQAILGQNTAEQIANNQTKVTLGGLKELNQSENVATATDRAEKGLG